MVDWIWLGGSEGRTPRHGMAPPAALSLLLSNHPSSPSPPHHRRRPGPGGLLVPPRPHTPPSFIHRHDKRRVPFSPSSPRLGHHVLRPAAAPAIAPGDHWGNWAFLLSAAAFGTWYVCFH